MKVITAPESYTLQPGEVSVFLAGGITNCDNWQNDVIKKLDDYIASKNLVVFNPRRENFPIDDSTAVYAQIAWEFEQLEKCDIFSMYFCSGESDQPICMYELGRNLLRMQTRFPKDWRHRIVISAESEYKRLKDVIVQTDLACGDLFINTGIVPAYIRKDHSEHIINAKRKIQNSKI